MTDVLEELTGDTLVRSHVEARVDDWERRIVQLYSLVDAWLPVGWTSRSNRTTRMLEEPMREVDLPPRELPVLDLLEMGESVAAIKPRVLWIVGANGRLDLTHGAEHWFITDAAENFEPSRWTITSVTNRFHRMPFDRAILTGILSSV
jgi:hypothetical protein